MSTFSKFSQTLHTSISVETEKKLSVFADEILRWNRRVNLTGAKSKSAFVEGPLFDALTVAPVLLKSGTLVDIGSGGGLPGIPLQLLCEDLEITLVEPRAKRAAFLRHVVHLLDLKIKIIQSRDETLPREQWSSAIAQAVFKPDEWLRRASGLVSPGGAIYVLSSEPLEKLPQPGCEIEESFHCTNPFNNASRYTTRVVRSRR